MIKPHTNINETACSGNTRTTYFPKIKIINKGYCIQALYGRNQFLSCVMYMGNCTSFMKGLHSYCAEPYHYTTEEYQYTIASVTIQILTENFIN